MVGWQSDRTAIGTDWQWNGCAMAMAMGLAIERSSGDDGLLEVAVSVEDEMFQSVGGRGVTNKPRLKTAREDQTEWRTGRAIGSAACATSIPSRPLDADDGGGDHPAPHRPSHRWPPTTSRAAPSPVLRREVRELRASEVGRQYALVASSPRRARARPTHGRRKDAAEIRVPPVDGQNHATL